jgi:hypothetical protein
MIESIEGLTVLARPRDGDIWIDRNRTDKLPRLFGLGLDAPTLP